MRVVDSRQVGVVIAFSTRAEGRTDWTIDCKKFMRHRCPDQRLAFCSHLLQVRRKRDRSALHYISKRRLDFESGLSRAVAGICGCGSR